MASGDKRVIFGWKQVSLLTQSSPAMATPKTTYFDGSVRRWWDSWCMNTESCPGELLDLHDSVVSREIRFELWSSKLQHFISKPSVPAQYTWPAWPCEGQFQADFLAYWTLQACGTFSLPPSVRLSLTSGLLTTCWAMSIYLFLFPFPTHAVRPTLIYPLRHNLSLPQGRSHSYTLL